MFIQHIRKHYFAYIIVIFTAFAVAASFYRFMVTYDYLVSYEGDCDPYTESCFVYCEDEECADPFYYSIIERNASEIRSLCGIDVTTCDDAYWCPDDVEVCIITYCDPVYDGEECELLTEDDMEFDNNEIET